MKPPVRSPSLVERIYGLLLRAYPASFRARFEAAMRETFVADERLACSRGLASCVRFWVTSVIQAARFGLLERRGRRRVSLTFAPSRQSSRWMPIDIRDAWRALTAIRARRWTAIVSVVLLTVALAVATMAFSLADSFVFHRLPYPHADRLVELRGAKATGSGSSVLPPEVVLEWRKHTDVFSAVHAHGESVIELASDGRPSFLFTEMVTPGLLEMLGAIPRWGRLLVEDDARAGAEPVLVISEDLARTRFGDPARAVGATIQAASGPIVVVGVVPEAFMFPRNVIRAWRAGSLEAIGPGSAADPNAIIALVAPALSTAQLIERLADRSTAVAQVARTSWPYVTKLRALEYSGTSQRVSTFVLSLAGAAWCLLLAAWAAVAGMELAGVATRTRRYAIQLALGATRTRLALGLCLEGLTLFAISTAAAALVSRAGLSILAANLSQIGLRDAFNNAVDLDGRALMFMSAVAAALWLAALAPVVVLAGRAEPIDVIKRHSRGATTGATMLRKGFTVVQVALAVTLLVFALLCIRTYTSLSGVDKGFDPHGVAVAVWSVKAARPTLGVEADALAARLRERPEVEGVVRVGQHPFSMQGGNPLRIEIEGREARARSANLRVNQVPPDYFATMRLPVSRGRLFRQDESPDAVIVSEGFAQRFSPDAEILGARFRIDASGPWREIVGVVPRVRHSNDGIGSVYPQEYEIYEPMPRVSTNIGRVAYFVLRLRVPAARPMIEDAIRTADPRAAYRVEMMDTLFYSQINYQRNMMRIASVFGALALAIAMAGIYAVMTALVTARTREIGIRVALGATVGHVRHLVLGSSLRLVILGAMLGVVAAFVGARWVASLFYGVTASDPLTYAVVAALLVSMALFATWRPARRAARIDPALTLRED